MTSIKHSTNSYMEPIFKNLSWIIPQDNGNFITLILSSQMLLLRKFMDWIPPSCLLELGELFSTGTLKILISQLSIFYMKVLLKCGMEFILKTEESLRWLHLISSKNSLINARTIWDISKFSWILIKSSNYILR